LLSHSASKQNWNLAREGIGLPRSLAQSGGLVVWCRILEGTQGPRLAERDGYNQSLREME